MRVTGGLSAAELLELADAGSTADAAQRGLLMLAAARPDLPEDALTDIGLGARDGGVMALRCDTFGDALSGRVNCPACGKPLAVSIERDELALAVLDGAAALSQPVRIEVGGVVVDARTLDGNALLAAASADDVAGARRSLIESSVLEARDGERRIDPLELSAEVLEAVGQAILAADPQAEIRVDLTCAECGHEWAPVLDLALFFWQELSAASTQILDDVHQLATGYGWSEAEVLTLSARRRRRYVERLLDV